MPKPYGKLRYAMEEAGIDRGDIAMELDKSATYVAHRFQRKQPWSIEDAYIILQMLGLPDSAMTEYFPQGGFS